MKRAEQGALGASNIQRQREGTSPPRPSPQSAKGQVPSSHYSELRTAP